MFIISCTQSVGQDGPLVAGQTKHFIMTRQSSHLAIKANQLDSIVFKL